MGTQEGERDWIDVANDLLSKCHINLRLRKLTDCDANVFVALYENILGEKVPDYIAAACSQEDDIHNVQSVIDSLSLDYLQISLSHITGENVVRGDKESIKNLLEIFDGLLEYLNEEISEESQNDEEVSDHLSEEAHGETKGPANCDATEQKENKLDGTSLSSNGESAVLSSKHSLQSLNAEEMGSVSELIGLGVSARTFTEKQEGPASPPQASDAVTASDRLDVPPTEPLYSAIALQPPNQSSAPQSPGTDAHAPSRSPTGLSYGHTEKEAVPVSMETSIPAAETFVTNGRQSPALCQSPAVSEKSSANQQRVRTGAKGEIQQPTNGGPRRVLYRTQPDVLFLTLQDEMELFTTSPTDSEDEEQNEEDLRCTHRLQDRRMGHRHRTGVSISRLEEGFEDPLSYRRQRNRKAEEELHDISENLSHRLEELDQMLKRVLGESEEPIEVREEDKRSHHSDSIMECRKTSGQHMVSGTADAEHTHRTHSLSPSPPRARRSLQGQLEDAVADTLNLDDGRQTDLAASDHWRRGEQCHRQSHRKRGKYLENETYKEELRRYEDKKRADLDKARLKAQEAERQYREAILSDVSQAPRLSPAKKRTQHRLQLKQTTPGRRRHEAPRRAQSMKVKENELLPVLLEELPHLHISPHALGRMWEQQMQQVDRLHALTSSHGHRRRSNLSSQVEEAQRKHDLLVELVRKEQDHSRRLRDFKERIQQQKSTQNRLREQRQQMARAKKYYDDYHVQHRARLMRARTKEERMFRQLFEEGLELQKVRLKAQRAYAREQQLEHQRRHQDQIESMENYYKDQFSLLAEKLTQERQELQVRKKAQEKALLKMKRELRSRMEHEIGELQKIIIQNDEDDYIQDLEVQRLRNQIQMASFQHNTSYLH